MTGALLELLGYVNEGRDTVADLNSVLDVSRRTICRQARKLEELGLLYVRRETFQCGRLILAITEDGESMLQESIVGGPEAVLGSDGVA